MNHNSFVKQHQSFFTLIQELSDTLIIGLSLWGAFKLTGHDWVDYHTIFFATASAVFFLVARYNGLYQSWRGTTLRQEATLVAKTFIMVIFLLLLISFSLRTTELFSRLAISSWLLVCPSLLILFRLLVRSFLNFQRASGRNTRTVAIAGAGTLALALADSIDQSPSMGLIVTGFYDDKSTESGMKTPIVGDLNQLRQNARAGLFDAIYIALPMRAEKQIKSLIHDLGNCSTTVYYVPDIFTFDLMNSRIRDVAGIPTISVYDSPLDGLASLFKRGQDVLLSLLALSVIALPMLLLAIIIKLDSRGPALFKQRRYGLSGEEFSIWKFRSMTTQDNGEVISQATKDDARVTRIGNFIRKTSLDELPQFLNVLQGTMSIVGPRPHAIAHNEHYRHEINDYMLRHIVKPGITGWAQVNGWRGETDTPEKMEKRIEFDLHYIRNWSMLFDIKIIFLTIFKGFINRNAY